MIFSKVGGMDFRDMAIGSPTVICALSATNGIYMMGTKSAKGDIWLQMPKLPNKGVPNKIDCAADGTVAVLSTSNTIYLWTGGQWNPIITDITGTIEDMSLGGINNLVFNTDKGEVWRYYAYWTQELLYGPTIPFSSNASLVAAGTDGTTIASFNSSTMGSGIHQFWSGIGIAPIIEGDSMPPYAMSVSDANSMFYVSKDFKFMEFYGNGVIKERKLKQLVRDDETYKYKYAPIPGKLVGVNAGTDRQVAIVIKESKGKYAVYKSIPVPHLADLLPEFEGETKVHYAEPGPSPAKRAETKANK